MTTLVQSGKIAFFWNTLFKFSTHLTNFALGIILARLLEPKEFGTLALAMVTVGVLSSFSSFGFGAAIIQKRRLHPSHLSSALCFNIVLNALLATTLFLMSDSLGHYYGNDEVPPILRALSAVLPISALSSVSAALLRKNLRLKQIGIGRLFASIIGGTTGIILAINGFGVWSLVVQSLTIFTLQTVLFLFLARWWPKLTFSLKALKSLWRFGFSIFLANVLDALFSRSDVLIFGGIISADMLGQYQRAKSVNTMISVHPSNSLSETMFPLLSKIHQESVRHSHIVISALHFTSFVVFLVIGATFFSAEQLVVFIYGPNWSKAGSFLSIILLSAFAYPIASILVAVLTSKGRSSSLILSEVAKKSGIGIHIAIGLVYGFEAFVYTLVLRTFYSTLVNLWFAGRELDIGLFNLGKPIFIQGTIMGLFILFVSFLDSADRNIGTGALYSGTFTFYYFCVSYILGTEPWLAFRLQLTSVLVAKFKNKRKASFR